LIDGGCGGGFIEPGGIFVEVPEVDVASAIPLRHDDFGYDALSLSATIVAEDIQMTGIEI